jgi:hypothetical protein
MKGKGVLHISLKEFAPFVEILVQDSGSGMKKGNGSKNLQARFYH